MDVAVIGAGPAGAAAAIGLAGRCSVLLLDRRAAPGDRIGETLPGAARQLLRALGHEARFLAEGHASCYARRSVWGGDEAVELDATADPAGPGWRLHRAAFERGLRAAAVERGGGLRAPTGVTAVAGEPGDWRLRLDGGDDVRARIVIDASGRGSRLLRGRSGRSMAFDRLVCAWTHLPLAREPAGITYVEAARDGWWYTAPLPNGRRVLAFHADADLTEHAALERMLDAARTSDTLRVELADSYASTSAPVRICAAHSARPAMLAGDGWLLAGDTALSFDPLSSQGLFNALYTGLLAARTAELMLTEDPDAATAYRLRLDAIWDAYRAHLRLFYAQERRWPTAPFWTRRKAREPFEPMTSAFRENRRTNPIPAER